jgi:hypothetical protein
MEKGKKEEGRKEKKKPINWIPSFFPTFLVTKGLVFTGLSCALIC